MKTAFARRGWKFWRWPVVAAAGVAALGASIPLLVPVSSFIPEITRVASEKIGQPVSVADLRLYLFPTPRVVASGISAGKGAEVSVAELEIVPDLLSFLSGPRSIRLVRARDVRMKQAAFAIPGAMPKSGGGGDAVLVRRIELRSVTVEHAAVKLPSLDVDLELGEGLTLARARIQSRDGALRISLEPVDGGSKVALHATQWTLPAGAPIRFDSLLAEGLLKGQGIDLARIEGTLYGGTLKGSARADWSRQWQLSGKASLAGMELLPVQMALGKPAQFSGRLKADATFSSRARTPDKLGDALQLDAPFEISGGIYHGYDLSKVGGLSAKLDKGGDTRFDELRGKVQLRGKSVKVDPLCARSPSLSAAGNVDIGANQELAGKLDVSVGKTGGFVGIPVQLKGTTSDPWFMPSKGYLIGAAIGTAVLPVIGTSIGSSLGSRFEGRTDCK
ncbi:MAG TPA: AsmA-like C-terminal region-containing protein [Burkholderiales bacterium]|nr:AsmA-like C-terminal region-containing protein [Burkholderiales bacterium]